MPMPHRTFAQVAKRRLVGKEGRERIREVRDLLAELPDYRNGPYADLRKWLMGEIEDTRVRSSAVHRDSIAVRREGAAQIALSGLPTWASRPSCRPSRRSRSRPATTRSPRCARSRRSTRIGGVLVQLVEIPGLIEGASDDRGGGRALLGVLRSVDAIVYCTRAGRRPARARGRSCARWPRPGIEKPTFLAATRADEADADAIGPARRRVSGPGGRARLDPRRGVARGLPERGVGAHRAAPGPPSQGRRGRSRAGRPRSGCHGRRRGRLRSTTIWAPAVPAHGCGARPPGSRGSVSVAITSSRTGTWSRSCAEAGGRPGALSRRSQRIHRKPPVQCGHEPRAPQGAPDDTNASAGT